MLLIKNGKVLAAGDDWMPLEEHRSKVVSVHVWPYEKSASGEVGIRYRDGAIGTFTAESHTEILEYLATIEGWPAPIRFTHPLPNVPFLELAPPNSGKVDEAAEEGEDAAEAVEEEAPVLRSRVRQINQVEKSHDEIRIIRKRT